MSKAIRTEETRNTVAVEWPWEGAYVTLTTISPQTSMDEPGEHRYRLTVTDTQPVGHDSRNNVLHRYDEILNAIAEVFKR